MKAQRTQSQPIVATITCREGMGEGGGGGGGRELHEVGINESTANTIRIRGSSDHMYNFIV